MSSLPYFIQQSLSDRQPVLGRGVLRQVIRLDLVGQSLHGRLQDSLVLKALALQRRLRGRSAHLEMKAYVR